MRGFYFSIKKFFFNKISCFHFCSFGEFEKKSRTHARNFNFIIRENECGMRLVVFHFSPLGKMKKKLEHARNFNFIIRENECGKSPHTSSLVGKQIVLLKQLLCNQCLVYVSCCFYFCIFIIDI